jgi:hypothetical protein
MVTVGCSRGEAAWATFARAVAFGGAVAAAACGTTPNPAHDATTSRAQAPSFTEVTPNDAKLGSKAPFVVERVEQAGRLWLTDRGTCALASNRDVYCWGVRGKMRHYVGPFLELVDSAVLAEDGKLISPTTPAAERRGDAMPQLPAFKHLVRSSSGSSGCGLKAQDSTLACFGVEKHPTGEFVDVVVGEAPSEFFCGVRPQGKVECWLGRPRDDSTPLLAPRADGRFRQISSYCGLRDDSSLSCWAGYFHEHPQQLPKLERLYYSTAGQVCGLDAQGQAGCWGAGASKPLVSARYDYAYFGDLHACGVIRDRVECWGYRGRGAGLIPGEVGSFIPNRPYKIGSTSLPLDVALEPLPNVDPPESGCRKRLVSETRGAVQVLAHGLLRVIPAEVGDGALVNLSVASSADPVWLSCPSGNYFRWSYADKSREGVRHDLVITRPGKSALVELAEQGGRSVRRSESTVSLRFSVAGFMLTETTSTTSGPPAFFSESPQLDRQALAVLSAQLDSAGN